MFSEHVTSCSVKVIVAIVPVSAGPPKLLDIMTKTDSDGITV